jgi:type II secretory pathway component PulF
MKFQYVAKDIHGKSVRGLFESESSVAVRQRLRSQGLYALSIDQVSHSLLGRLNQHHSSLATSSFRIDLPLLAGKYSSRTKSSDLMVVLSQLSIMCQSGDDLAEALNTVANQCQASNLKTVLVSVYQEVSQGTRFSVALAKHPKVFNESLVAALAAGEQSGRIVEVLERTTRLMRNDQLMRSTVLSMLMYPAVLCTITLTVIFSMLFFVLPQFATIFSDMGKPIPPLTNVLLALGTNLRSNWIAIAILVALAIGAAWTGRTHPQVRRAWDFGLLNFVLTKNFARALITGRIFRLLGTMLESGVPLLESVRLCRNATRNLFFQQMFDQVEQDLLKGEGMSQSLVAAAFLPPGAAHMISTGERTGKLPQVLQTVGEYFESDGERRLRTLVKMLEPAIIVGLGGIVGVVVLSIILPLLDVTTASS